MTARRWPACGSISFSASSEPCALLVEDAQWSDPESIAWIDHLLARASGRSLFVMMMMRPSFWRDQAQRFTGRAPA